MERAIATAHLYLLFTPELCSRDPWETLEQSLDGGVQLVQWRVKNPSTPGLRRCIDICAAREVPVIVNDHVELACEVGAAGAHVGQDDMPAARAREILLDDMLLGVSTHDTEQLVRAVGDGADHVGFGPIFATRTKGYDHGKGPRAAGEICARSDVPVFAIGGINATNVVELVTAGCRRVAVSRAILASTDPATTAATILEQLLP